MLEENPEDTRQATILAEQIGELNCRELVRLVRSIATVRSTLTPTQREVLKKCDY